MRIDPSGSTYLASFGGGGRDAALAISEIAQSNATRNVLVMASVQARQLGVELGRVERQVALRIRGDDVLAFLREDHAHVLLHERVDRRARRAADEDVDEAVERIASRAHVLGRGA